MKIEVYAKIKQNRDRHEVVTGRIEEANTLLKAVSAADTEEGGMLEVKVNPLTSDAPVSIRREILNIALYNYINSEADRLHKINEEFRAL